MATVKVSVNLPEDAIRALKDIARRDGVTMTEALRRSITLQQFVDERQTAGAKILIEEPDKTIERLIIR